METRARPPHTSINTCSVCERTPSRQSLIPHTWKQLPQWLFTAGLGARSPGRGRGDPQAPTPQPVPEHRDIIAPLPVAGHGHGHVHPLLRPQRPPCPRQLPGKDTERLSWPERQNPRVSTPSCKSSQAKHVGTAGKEPWEPEHTLSSQTLYAFCTFVFSRIIYLFVRK